jgi:nicotinic acid phosphoribosyltransferase
VYKLVQLCGSPRIKLSNESVKVCIPGKKQLYRLYDDKGGTHHTHLHTETGCAILMWCLIPFSLCCMCVV